MKTTRYTEEIRIIVAETNEDDFQKWKAKLVQRMGGEIEDQILRYHGLRLLCQDLKGWEGGPSYPNLRMLLVNRNIAMPDYDLTEFWKDFIRLEIPKPILFFFDLQRELAKSYL